VVATGSGLAKGNRIQEPAFRRVPRDFVPKLSLSLVNEGGRLTEPAATPELNQFRNGIVAASAKIRQNLELRVSLLMTTMTIGI
jgi:hypothetical protein